LNDEKPIQSISSISQERWPKIFVINTNISTISTISKPDKAIVCFSTKKMQKTSWNLKIFLANVSEKIDARTWSKRDFQAISRIDIISMFERK